MHILSVGIAVWIACGVASWGLSFAYYQRNWPTIAAETYFTDLLSAACIGLLLGPIALVSFLVHVATSTHGFRGFKLF